MHLLIKACVIGLWLIDRSIESMTQKGRYIYFYGVLAMKLPSMKLVMVVIIISFIINHSTIS